MEYDLQAFGSDVDPPCLRQNSRNSLKGKTNSSRSPTARSTSQEGALSHSPSNQSQQGKFDWAKKFYFVRDHFSPSLPAINLLSLSSRPKNTEKEEKETCRSAAASASSSVDFDSGLNTLNSKGPYEIRAPTGKGDVDNKKTPSFPCSGSQENLSIKAEIELVEKAAESKFPECPDQTTPSFYFYERTAGDDGGPYSERLRFAQEPENLKAAKDRSPDSDDLQQRAIKAGYLCLQDKAKLNQNDLGEDCAYRGEREFPKCGIIKERADEETDVNHTGVSRVSDNDERETDARDSYVKSLEAIHSETFSYLDAHMTPSASTDETVTTTCLEEQLSDSKSLLPHGTFKGVWPENRVPGNTLHICAIRSDASQHQLTSPQKETILCNVDEQSHGGIKQQDSIYTRKPVHAIVDTLNSCCDIISVWDSNSVLAKSTEGKITSCNNTETNTQDIRSQAESEALRKNTKKRSSRIPKLIQPFRTTPIDITLEKSIPKPSLLSKSGVRESLHDENKSHAVLSPSKKSCAQAEMTHRVHIVSRQSIRDITRSETTIPNPFSDTFTVVRDSRSPSRPSKAAILPLKRSATTIKFHSAENVISRNNSPEASQWANSPKSHKRLHLPHNSLSFIPTSHSSLKPKVSFASDIESNQQPVKMKLKLPSFNRKTETYKTTKPAVLLEQPENIQANHAQGGQEWSETHHKADFHKVSSGHRRGSRLPRRTVTDPNLPRRTGTTGFGFSGKTQISVQHTSEVNIKSIMKKNNHNAGNVLCPKNSYTCDVGVNENTNSIQKPEKNHAEDIIYQYLLSPQMFSGGLKFPKTFKLGSSKLPPNSQEARQFCKTISRLTTEKSSSFSGCFCHAPMPLFCTHLCKSKVTGQKSEIILACKNIQESSKNLNKCGLIASRLKANQQSHSENCAGSFVGYIMSTNQASLHQQKEKEDSI